MSFFRDDPSYLHEVVWYEVPKDAPALGLLSPFVTRVYDRLNQEEQPTLGERYHGRRYAKGEAPYFVDGTHMCGTAEQWLYGCTRADPRPQVVNGAPVCCGPVGLIAAGGKALAATAQAGSKETVHPVAGGVLLDGQVVRVAVLDVAGGVLIDGQVAGQVELAVAGGVLIDGQVVPHYTPAGALTPACTAPLPLTLTMESFSRTGSCACLPTTLVFVWDAGAQLYQCTTHSPSCAGFDTIHWQISFPGVPRTARLIDPVGHVFANQSIFRCPNDPGGFVLGFNVGAVNVCYGGGFEGFGLETV